MSSIDWVDLAILIVCGMLVLTCLMIIIITLVVAYNDIKPNHKKHKRGR